MSDVAAGRQGLGVGGLMPQLDFFQPNPAPDPDSSPDDEWQDAAKPLWPHQEEALVHNAACWEHSRRILDVMATGTGKTRIAIEEMRRTPGRCLFLADRDVIVGQAQAAIREALGEPVGREQAGWYGGDERIIVASVPTLRQPDRLMRWKPDTFDLVIYDEAHHSVAAGARAVLAHFGDTRRLGLTATPDRTDEQPLGAEFDETAFVYGIYRAIKDGVLVEPSICQVKVNAIDFSGIASTGSKDFTDEQVASVIEAEGALHGIAAATVEHGNLRRTLGFAPSVRAARMLTEICNRYAADKQHPHGLGYARSIDCSMGAKEVRDTIMAHKEGDFTALWNYGITVEGYDDPGITCLAMARPTKSRLVCEQIVGRLLRFLAGKTALLLEFTGNLGKHRLSGAVDVLGSDMPEEVVERARKKVEAGEPSPMVALKQAEAERQAELARIEREKLEQIARRAALTARVDYSIMKMDPFSVMNIERPDDSWAARFSGKVPSEGMTTYLKKVGVEVSPMMTFAQAQRLIGVLKMRQSRGLASFKQIRCLKVFGINAFNMYMHTASRVIGWMATEAQQRQSKKWVAPSPEKMRELVSVSRTVGEEG